ncbi:MAG: PQQ-like beta-propeller repeat protein [Bdellovibrionaceae bacterium]|nr:PQQ-like beta-propeller repeat protein [Pseudobdellovibrionaceae bacterium]
MKVIMKKYNLEKLIEWKGPEKADPFPGLPALSRRPNPLAIRNLVVVSSFKSCSVFALQKKSGKVVWSFELGTYGGHSLSHNSEMILAGTVRGIFCLSLASGKKNWSYEPYDKEQESFYSEAICAGDSVFIADRYGYLHALRAKTGSLKWKVLLSPSGKYGINATVTVVANRIYAVSTGGELSCVDAKTGKLLWVLTLDEGSIRPPIVSRGKIYIQGEKNIFLIDLKTRDIGKIGFNEIIDICVLGRSIYIIDKRISSNSSEGEDFSVFAHSQGHSHQILRMKERPSGFFPVAGKKHLGILGSGKLIFLNVEKERKEAEVLGLFSSIPFVEKSRIYSVGLLNEAVCFRNPAFEV